MARKSDSCLTPSIKGERRLHETPILRRSDSIKTGEPTSGPFIFGLFREHPTWKAPVRVLLYLTGWRTRTAVTMSGALAHDWSLRQRPGSSSSTCRPGADDAGSLPRFRGGRLRD